MQPGSMPDRPYMPPPPPQQPPTYTTSPGGGGNYTIRQNPTYQPNPCIYRLRAASRPQPFGHRNGRSCNPT
jgi:hypothetical protein